MCCTRGVGPGYAAQSLRTPIRCSRPESSHTGYTAAVPTGSAPMPGFASRCHRYHIEQATATAILTVSVAIGTNGKMGELFGEVSCVNT
jgi:hypothetical protein